MVLTRRDLFLGKLRAQKPLTSERAATATEYALLVGVTGVVAVATWSKMKRRRKPSD